MHTIKFGSSDVAFNIVQRILTNDDKTIQVGIKAEGVDFSALANAVEAYGGKITEYDEQGNKFAIFNNYEDKPSITYTYYQINGDFVPVYQLFLTPFTKSDSDSLKASIKSLTDQNSTLEKNVESNTADVASALEGVASLFEMMTATSTTTDDTSEAEASTETADTSATDDRTATK